MTDSNTSIYPRKLIEGKTIPSPHENYSLIIRIKK